MLDSSSNLFKDNLKTKKQQADKHKILLNNIAGTVGNLIGNEMSRNSQLATDTLTEGMELFRGKAEQIIINVDYKQAKGNLFEYIEAAKFNAEAASLGSNIRAEVTDTGKVTGYNCHSAADIVLKNENNSVIKEVQLKAYQDFHDAVRKHTGYPDLGKFDGMDRLIPKDQDIDEAKRFANSKAETGLFNSHHYKDVHDKLTNELHSDDGVSSGGTTFDELKSAYDSPNEYAESLKFKQLRNEVANTAENMAICAGVTTAIVSTVKNTYEIFKDGKEIKQALKDILKDSGKSAVRGGVTGAGSATIRYFANTKNNLLINDSCAATVVAGSAIDSGVILWKLASREIGIDEAEEELAITSVKGIATVLFTKGIGCILGASTGALLPIAIYSALSVALSSGFEIVKNAKLKKNEYERLEAFLKEIGREREKYYKEALKTIGNIEKYQREKLKKILKNIDKNLFYGSNYEKALTNFSSLSRQLGFSLKYETEEEFRRFMQSDDCLVFD